MKSVRHVIELLQGESLVEVLFVRDTDDHWHADVKLSDGSTWAFRQDVAGPFHPCELHAERLAFTAKAMVNSGRAA